VSLSTQAETDIESSLPASDPDNDPLVFSVIVEPTFGSLILNSDGSYIYKPSAEFTGTDSFTYAVSDGQVSNVSGTINIVITPLNVSFLEQSRLAFGQREDATPVSVNGRLFTQDVSGTSDYQDLIDANAN
jgi:VCBS repeat-containing protein